MLNISKIATFFNNFIFVSFIAWRNRKPEIEKNLPLEKRLLVNSGGTYCYTPLHINELFYRQNVYSTKN